MENQNMFLKATRQKLRWPSKKGLLSLEDLWDLPMTSERGVSLNGLYEGLTAQRDTKAGQSLINTNSTNTELELKIDIVRAIFGTKSQESIKRKYASEKREKKAKILSLIEQKKDAALSDTSVEDLEKMLAAL